MSTALAIFVKTPGYSPVKTRLAHTLGEIAAVAFHDLAARAVGEVACATGDDLQPYWAVAEKGALNDPRWRNMPRIGQGEGALGERMHRVYAGLYRRHERVMLTGADVPQQTPELLRQACSMLDEQTTPFVLGEASDGGFWLVGGRAPIARQVWTSIVYSRPDTASQFRKALCQHDRVAALPALTDVDWGSDLPILANELATLAAPLPTQSTLLHWLEPRSVRATKQFASGV